MSSAHIVEFAELLDDLTSSDSSKPETTNGQALPQEFGPVALTGRLPLPPASC